MSTLPSHIEDTLRAETPTEFALLERISQLKRQLWEGGRLYNTVDGFPPDPNSVPREVRDFSPTLRLAGTSEASLDIPRGVKIEARTNGPRMLGYAFYMSFEELRAVSFGFEARMLIQLLEKAARSAGKLMLTEAEKTEAKKNG